MSAASSNALDANPFDGRIIAGLIIAGIIGFVSFWVLSAFAPELSSGRNGEGHALSRSAVGFAGVVELARAGGHRAQVIRDPDAGVAGASDSELGGLLVLTPKSTTLASEITDRIDDTDGSVLIILPKYQAMTELGGADRVARYNLAANPAAVLQQAEGAEAFRVTRLAPSQRRVNANLWGEGEVTLHLPPQLQLLSGKRLKPVISIDGATLVGELAGRGSTYVLSDPDLLNNLAMHDDARAAAALDMLRALAGPGEPIGFDVTLNGLGGGQQSLLRMAFTPPFLALTLCLLFAGLLALWQGFVRFGPPWREERGIALGKRALVATHARLVVQARRTRHFGARYGAMIREAAARRLHAPSQLGGLALDDWLDRFADSKGRRFSALLERLESARTTDECVASARALGQWRKDVLRDSE